MNGNKSRTTLTWGRLFDEIPHGSLGGEPIVAPPNEMSSKSIR